LSSIGEFRGAKHLVIASYLVGLGLSGTAAAQEQSASDTQSENVQNILADADRLYGPPPPMEDCSAEQEAAILSGEIIVCRRRKDQSEFRTLPSDEAQSRYAEETMNRGNPQTPDVAGPGIFRGPATMGGLCLIPPCPKDPVIIIDIAALPEAPPGSDADRIARGLPPLNQDDPTSADAANLPKPEGSAEPGEEQ
jgi:hypothetical protein